jgi:hypothetical protein
MEKIIRKALVEVIIRKRKVRSQNQVRTRKISENASLAK